MTASASDRPPSASPAAADLRLRRVAHELRGPLEAIRLATDLLSRQALDAAGDEAADLLALIRRQLAQCDGLVQRLLDPGATGTADGTGNRTADETADDVLRPLLADLAVVASSRGVELIDETGDAAPRWPLDAVSLRQVVTNLVLNAIDASRPGGRVRVAAMREPPGLAVVDEGGGAATGTPLSAGTGLGLPLVREIIAPVGGRLSVEPSGTGTRAEVRIETALPTAAPKAGEDGFAAGPLAGLMILLVEDDIASATLLARSLNLEGASVQVAGAVAEAVRLSRGQSFAVAIVDEQLPDGTGSDLAVRLADRVDRPALLSLSGWTPLGADAAPFDRRLTKPVSVDRLVDAIVAVCSLNRGR